MARYKWGGSPMVSQTSGELTNIEKTSQLFKILGNPKRLRLIYLLIQHSMSVSEISERLHWEQSGVSHQLQILRKLHLVQQHRHGKPDECAEDVPFGQIGCFLHTIRPFDLPGAQKKLDKGRHFNHLPYPAPHFL